MVGYGPAVDRTHRLESLRRSLAMLQPGSPSHLTREQAIALIEDFQAALRVLADLRTELRRLGEERRR